MTDVWGLRPAGLPAAVVLVVAFLTSGHNVSGAEFYCDEQQQRCHPERCDTCSTDVIYRSAVECELSCSSADADMQSAWSCVLPPEQGPCRGWSRRWHFDLKVGECRDFKFGGCLGNSNNFGTLAECRQVCEYRIGNILPMLNVSLSRTDRTAARCIQPRPDHCSGGADAGTRFAFDQQHGQCRRFQWAGCDADGNVFTSQLACQIQCEGIRPLFPVHPPQLSAGSSRHHAPAERIKSMPEDEDYDPCLLLPDVGSCIAYSPRLFYDADHGVCRRFLYGGCDGNLNNFHSVDTCYRTCNSNATEAAPLAAACLAPKRVGNCSSHTMRFYYDEPTARCRAFRFSGCGGSENNFLTLAACVATCRPPAEDMPSPGGQALAGLDLPRARHADHASAQGDVCSMPPAVGPCEAEMTRWHYDPIIGRCRKFLYGGCQGNGNNFASRAACEDSCGRRRPEPRGDRCGGPHKEVGSRFCNARLQRYTFSEASDRCERIIFDGCGATANNYRTLVECESTCQRRPVEEPAERVCRLLPDPGRCDAQIDRFYYEPSSGRCRRLIYRGCRGNANNFQTMRECMSTCQGVGPEDAEQDAEVDCSAPPVSPDTRSCSESIRRFYYSVLDGRCVSLLYGGCGATDNNFATLGECERSCPPGSVNQTEVCLARPGAVGNCLGSIRRYTYDPATATCSQFDYTGCGGNENNFASRRECLAVCRGVTEEENSDMCTLPMEVGPCSGAVTRYFYDPSAGRCQRFTYGGCEGNGNNFDTELECLDRCSGTQPTQPPPIPDDVCRQRSLVGPCADSITRYYFDQYEQRCQQFIYSGCGGNENNFETRRQCEQTCRSDPEVTTVSPTSPSTRQPDPSDELCSLPPEAGPCFASLPRFYFDPFHRECRPFTYGGCSGNANNFLSLAACSRRCLGGSERPARCLAPGADACDDSPRREQRAARSFYYDASASRCVARAGGDCGSRNSFRTAATCREECAVPEAARAVCTLPAEHGECAGRERRWAYNARAGRCQPFEYGGCGGNANNFASLRECLSSCRGMELSDATEVPDTCLEPLAADDFCEPSLRARRRWTFNAEQLRCDSFESFGCEAGLNTFTGRSACERACLPERRPTPPPEDRCGQEPRPVFDCVPGRRRTVYFYVANRDTCLTLTDRGCLSGANKYPTKQACMRSCSRGGGGGDDGDDGDDGGGRPDPAVCRLPVLPGSSCKGRIRRWAFSSDTGRCEQFFYTGCDGNENNFQTERECRDLCGNAVTPVRETPEYCLRPPRRLLGCRPSSRSEERFYYNSNSGTCDSFIYNGCDSGSNMFTSRRACRMECMSDGRDEDTGRDERPEFCYLDPERVPNCRPGRRQTKYYFSSSAGRCLSMQSVGCERESRNSFSSLTACEAMCDPHSTEDADDGGAPSFCRLPPETIGDCRRGRRQTMYTFSTADRRCRAFDSYGCERGRNMFFSLRDCEEQCGAGDDEDDAVCTLRPEPGRCSRFETRWYRDSVTDTCETFQYGGCGGNGNNFPSRAACLERCDTDTRAENEICNQPPETGDRPCQREEQRYYWDTRSGVCRSYRYSGCGATDNNFFSLRECTDMCRRRGGQGDRRPTVPERCLEQPERKSEDAGGCGVQTKRYTYSSNRGFCVPFTYTGCEETGNNFMTRSECRETCQPKDQCVLKMDPGRRCDARRPMDRFAYDPALGGCRRFRYAGCGGNDNNFATQRQCALSCSEGAAAEQQEVCLLPPVEDGAINCGDREDRYFFDSALGRCVSFTFTGCLPTANNFLTMTDCQSKCPEAEQTPPRDAAAVCALEKMPGHCLSRVLRYFFDADEQRCRPFVYTACDGNANNFLTFRACASACDPRRRSLELGEDAVRSELRLLMARMAPGDRTALEALESTTAADVTTVSTLEP